ncbi:hypothetical protein Dimus_007702, partial [Dionaea muscipula]
REPESSPLAALGRPLNKCFFCFRCFVWRTVACVLAFGSCLASTELEAAVRLKLIHPRGRHRIASNRVIQNSFQRWAGNDCNQIIFIPSGPFRQPFEGA